MANEAYICRIDTTLSAGIVQITDLRPNTSRRSLTYDKVPQSGYLPARVENDAVQGNTAAGVTTSALSGLAAYLVDVVAQNTSGDGLSETIADDAAGEFIAQADAGIDIDANRALVTIGGATAGTTLDSNGSVGSLLDVLKILAGGSYTVPAGTAVDGTAAFKGSADGSFDDDGYRQIYQSGALTMSVSEGDLAQHIADGYCVVYNDDGEALS
jgi:hypothetical protein